MSPHPRDEFDEIDESTAPRGAYRGRQVDRSTSGRGLVAIVLAGVLSLLVGGFMYVNSPRTASPEAAARASSSASATASPTGEGQPSVDPASVTVEVYNSSAPDGAAPVAANVIERAGYTVSVTGNWAGAYTAESSVNFATGASGEANQIADALGLPFITQDFSAGRGQIYVVLGADFDPSAFADSQGAEQSSPTPEPTPSAQDSPQLYVYDAATGTYLEATEESANGQQLYTFTPGVGYSEYTPQQSQEQTATETYSFDPVSGTYVQDPAGTYIYDPNTGTYQQR